MNKILSSFLAAALCFFSLPTSALVWEPPSTIKVVVGQSPGGGPEFAFRGVTPMLEKNNPKTRFIIEHRPGMDNVVAMNHFAAQKPDGTSVLVLVQVSGMVVAPIAFKNYVKTDPMTYKFVTTIAKSPMAFIVHPNSEFKNIRTLMDQARDPKNQINVGLSGSINQLAYSFFVERSAASVDVVKPIRFSSALEASIAVASGSVDVAIVPLGVAKALIDANKVKLLAHAGSSHIPGVQTALMKDHIPDFVLESAYSVFLPPGTPDVIVDWYSQQIIQALAEPSTKIYFSNSWATIDQSALGPQGLANSIDQARKTWLPIANRVLEIQK